MSSLLRRSIIACGLVLAATIGEPAAAATVTACDRLATDPADRNKVAAGASYEELVSEAAETACAEAIAAEAGNPRLAYQYGRLLVLRNKSKEGLPHLSRAAEAGYLAAQLVLASGYASGAHFKVDAIKSHHWYTKAAEQGSKYAQASVGLLLVEGKGVYKDVEKGIALLEKAAAGDNAFAEYSLGVLFLNGALVKKDVPRAIKHYERARKAGLGAAFIALGLLYVTGEGVEKDLKKAQAIFVEGAEAGHNDVRMLLAQYYQGKFFKVANPDAEARRWLCKAGPQGAQLHIQMYRGEKLVCK